VEKRFEKPGSGYGGETTGTNNIKNNFIFFKNKIYIKN
jgi:hypothetical protein